MLYAIVKMAGFRQESGRVALGYQSRIKILKDQTLGIGSYGAVYKAQCGDLICAAKVLHRTLFDQSLPAQPGKDHRLPIMRFEQECEFMSSIKHPNIVQYLGTYQDPESGLPVLLMELMERSLTNYLESSNQPLPHHIQVNLTHDVALALSFLHSSNIIHRDLSSNNVLLIGTARAKVTDFGMARLEGLSFRRDRGTITMCPGTEVYMPPEAREDRPRYNEKIDCFSFGVIVIQTITRQFPNPGDRQIEVSDSRYTRALRMNVPEIDRRQNHISQVDGHHPLLPIALDCLKDRDVERPSAHELCERIVTLKNHRDYRESVQATEEGDRSTERSLRQLVIQQEQMLQSQINQLQEDINQRDRDILQRDKTIASTEHVNSQLNRRLQQCSEAIQQLEREKSQIAYEKDEQLERLQEQLRSSKTLLERQRREVHQQSTQSSVVRTEKYSKVCNCVCGINKA